MNFTFLDRPLTWDLLFLLILAVCITAAYKRGAIRAVSGIAGTILGVVFGTAFHEGLSQIIEPMLRPVILDMAQKADLSRVGGLEEGSVLSDLVAQSGQLQDKLAQLYQRLMEQLALRLSQHLAPIISFLLLFFLIKLVIWLLCRLFDLDIPFLSRLNRLAGGLLGAVSGGLIILALCWAVMSFAPQEELGFLSRPCLMGSLIGGRLAPLFTLH